MENSWLCKPLVLKERALIGRDSAALFSKPHFGAEAKGTMKRPIRSRLGECDTRKFDEAAPLHSALT